MKKKIIDFSKYSSIKIGPRVEVRVIESEDEIDESFLDRYFLIGGANNLLLSPTPPPLAMLGKNFDFIKIEDNSLIVGAAVRTGRLLSFAKKNNIASLEFIAKLPGTIGGMVAMNAGVKSYEIFNIIKELKINGKWVKKENIEYGYRFAKINGVVTEVKLELKEGYDESLRLELIQLRNNQPKEPSAGSAFKNPKGDYAGRLIEAVGLKGHRVGNMAFSQMHANFLINLGGGTFSEAIELLNLAKNRVKEEFKIELKEEVKIVDFSFYEGQISTTKEYIEFLYESGIKKSNYLSEKELIEFFDNVGVFRLKGYIKELKKYRNKSIDDLVLYYLFDRFLAKNLFTLCDELEIKLKSILVKKYYNATKNHFAYLIKDNHNWSDFKFDIPTINNWKIDKNEKNEKESYAHFIKFYKQHYSFFKNKEKYLKNKILLDDLNESINYPPFKYLIESATLGLVISLILSLDINKHNMKKLIAKEFKVYEKDFKNYLLRFKELRNRITHLNRLFNRTYRSVKGIGDFKKIRKGINNHKILDVYLFLIFLLNGLYGIDNFQEFEKKYIKKLIKNFKEENICRYKSLVKELDNGKIHALINIMKF